MRYLTLALALTITGTSLLAFANGDPKETRTKPLTYKNNYKYPRHEFLVLNADLLGQCMAAFILKNGGYTLGNSMPHKSSYLQYLSGTASIDYFTGKEETLRAWVLSQPENSIDPLSIFEKSYQLNKSDLFDALLTIHELLRNQARFYMPYIHYSSTYPQMQNLSTNAEFF